MTFALSPYIYWKGANIMEAMQAAIFDMDGTLLDSMGMWRALGENYLKRRGLSVPADLRRTLERMSLGQAAAYMAEAFPLNTTPEDLLRQWRQMADESYRTEIGLKPGIVEYLQYLKGRHVPMAVATLTDREHVLPALERHHLLSFFDAVLTVQEAGRDKRYPDIYLQCAERCGAEVSNCAVFEDSVYAARTVKAAGFFLVAVDDDASREDEPELRHLSDRYIHDFRELIKDPI